MNASELIKKLEALVAEHGDLYVENEKGEAITVEFNDDDAPATTPVFVVY